MLAKPLWLLNHAPVRALIQRVANASVTIDSSIVANIERGLLVLLGIEAADTLEDIEWLCGKIVRLRVFDDANGVMSLSVLEIGGEILVVSQFTLFASTRKGNRPSYSRSAAAETAIPLYEQFLRTLEQHLGKRPQRGRFGAHMLVGLTNDGPVTILVDSKLRE